MRSIKLVKYLLFAGMLWCSHKASGQMAPHYSQYMFNQLVLNPAYAGRDEALSATMIQRWQWNGIIGAPKTLSFGIHSPSRNLRHGFGASLFYDQIGATSSLSANGIYAYKIPVGESGNLSLGLQGGISSYRVDLLALNARDQDDVVIGANTVNLLLPNAGTGMFFHTKRFYLGVSVPRLLNHSLGSSSGDIQALQSVDLFVTTGYVFHVSNDLQMKPSVLVKKASAVPFNVDLNLQVLFRNKLWAGVSYRTTDALVGMLEWQINPQFRFGYAYDLNLSRLSSFNSGSHELMLGFDLRFERAGLHSPRFF